MGEKISYSQVPAGISDPQSWWDKWKNMEKKIKWLPLEFVFRECVQPIWCLTCLLCTNCVWWHAGLSTAQDVAGDDLKFIIHPGHKTHHTCWLCIPLDVSWLWCRKRGVFNYMKILKLKVSIEIPQNKEFTHLSSSSSTLMRVAFDP